MAPCIFPRPWNPLASSIGISVRFHSSPFLTNCPFLKDDWKNTPKHTFIHIQDWNKEAPYLSYQRHLVHVLPCRWIIYVDTSAYSHTTQVIGGGDADTGPLYAVLFVTLCERALCWLLSLWRDVESPRAWWWMGVLSPVRSSCLYSVFMLHVLLLYHKRCVCVCVSNLHAEWAWVGFVLMQLEWNNSCVWPRC